MSQEARHKNIQLSTIEEERDDALAAEKPKSSSELRKPAIDDYIVLKCLGKSTFGEVMLAKSKLDKKKYALKMLSKIKMEKDNAQLSVMSEREFLSMMRCRQIPRLHHCFQDQKFLYFVSEYCSGGNLAEYIQDQKSLPLAEVRKICAEIVVILKVMRSYGMCHRDLKPHNLVFDAEGHLKLVDFGKAKLYELTEANANHYEKIKKVLLEYEKKHIIKQSMEVSCHYMDDGDDDLFDEGKNALVGSGIFSAPETLINGYSDYETDFWSFGIIVYFLLFGTYPFQELHATQPQLLEKICEGNIDFPQLTPPAEPEAIDLIKKLLTRDPKKRLGCGRQVQGAKEDFSFDALLRHPFFKDVDFDRIYEVKGQKVIKNLGHKNGDDSTRSPITTSATNSSFNSSNTGSMSCSRKVEVLAQVETKRKKFMFIEVVGSLTIFSDHTIRYDQIYDNSSRVFKFKKISRVDFNEKKLGIYIDIKSTGKCYDLKVTNGKVAFDKFVTVYEELARDFLKRNSLPEE